MRNGSRSIAVAVVAVLMVWSTSPVHAQPPQQPKRVNPAPAPAPADGMSAPPGATVLGSPALAGARKVSAATFSPDGKHIAAADDDGGLDLWDAATGRRVLSLGPVRDTADLAYSPDGATLYAAGYAGELRAWSTANPRQPPRVVKTGKKFQRLAISPDGETLATGGDEICLWDASGDPLAVLGSNGQRTTSLSFSDDGATLVSAGFDKTIRVWDVAQRKARRTINVGGPNSWMWGEISPDGKTIVASGGSLRLRDAQTGKEMRRLTFAGGGSTGAEARYSPDGKLIAIDSLRGGAGGVIIYDVRADKEIARLDAQHGGMIRFTWSRDSTRLLVFDIGPRMQLWDVANARQLHAQAGHRRQVLAVAASPDGRTIATGDADGHLILWNALTGAPREIEKPGPNTTRTPFNHSAVGAVFDLAFSPDSAELLVADAVGVTAWSLDTLAKLRATSATNRSVWEIAVSGDGSRMAVGIGPGKVEVTDRASGKLIQELAVSPETRAFALAGDGKRLFCAGEGAAVQLFDSDTGKALTTWDLPGPDAISRVAASPDGRWVAGGSGGRLYLWDAQSGQLRATRDARAERAAFSLDGNLLAVAGAKSLEIWEMATNARVASLAGHGAAEIRAIGFMPDGRRLITGADDATVIVWDLAQAIAAPAEDEAKFPRVRLDRLWRQLDDPDPAVAYRAVASLVRTPDDAITLLAPRLRDPAAAGTHRAARADTVLSWIGTDQAAALRKQLPGAATRMTTTTAATKPATRTAKRSPATTRMTAPVAKRDLADYPDIRYPIVHEISTFYTMVDEGDWRVLPTIFSVVTHAADRPPDKRDSLTEQAIDAAGTFRLKAMRPALLKLYHNERADITLRERAAVALAQLGDDADVAELTQALSGEVLGADGRFRVSIALLPRDVDAAREVLIDGYKEYLAGMADNSHFALERVREILQSTSDAKLVERIDALVPQQTVQGAKSNIAGLVNSMRIEGRPIDEVVALVRDDAWAGANARYNAIHTLGRRGGPEHVQVLKDLKPWARGSGGDFDVQQRLVQAHAAKAIAEIRRRHWQHFYKLEADAKTN